jgi:hypothetical protein
MYDSIFANKWAMIHCLRKVFQIFFLRGTLFRFYLLNAHHDYNTHMFHKTCIITETVYVASVFVSSFLKVTCNHVCSDFTYKFHLFLCLPRRRCPVVVFIHSFIHSFIHQWLYSPSLGPGLISSFVICFYTHGRTPWTSDQSVARSLPTHRTTQTQNKRTHRQPCLEWNSNPWSQSSSES